MLLFGMALWLGMSQTQAEEPGKDQLESVQSQLNNLDYMPKLLTSCPADIMGKRNTFWRRLTASSHSWSETGCKNNFSVCVNACLSSNNSVACFNMARVFEILDDTTYALAKRQGFALSCALGNASGCTNRGATLRNAEIDEDPFFATNMGDKNLCFARTFSKACSKNDEWGCAMEGQSHRLGEGTPVDLIKARKRLEKACLLSNENKDSDTERAPCRFAKWQMQLIDDHIKQ